MVWAATLGLPLSLEGVGAVLGLEKQKLKEEKALEKIRKKKRKALETAARQAEKDAEVLEKYRRKFEERLMRKSKGKTKNG